MLIDIFKQKQTNRKSLDSLALLITSIIGGYTISNFPHEYLSLLGTPLGRFISFVLILKFYYKDEVDVTLIDIVIEAFIYTLLFHLIEIILKKKINK